jgi:hypothetical protein
VQDGDSLVRQIDTGVEYLDSAVVPLGDLAEEDVGQNRSAQAERVLAGGAFSNRERERRSQQGPSLTLPARKESWLISPYQVKRMRSRWRCKKKQELHHGSGSWPLSA